MGLTICEVRCSQHLHPTPINPGQRSDTRGFLAGSVRALWPQRQRGKNEPHNGLEILLAPHCLCQVAVALPGAGPSARGRSSQLRAVAALLARVEGCRQLASRDRVTACLIFVPRQHLKHSCDVTHHVLERLQSAVSSRDGKLTTHSRPYANAHVCTQMRSASGPNPPPHCPPASPPPPTCSAPSCVPPQPTRSDQYLRCGSWRWPTHRHNVRLCCWARC